jgi:hypothetical protein
MSYGGLGGLGTPPPLLYHPHPQLGGLGSDGGFSLGSAGGVTGGGAASDDDMSPDADNMDDLASDPLSPHNDITRSFVRMSCHPLGQTALRRTASQALLAFAKILLKIATDGSLARWRKFKRLKPHLTSIGGLLCGPQAEVGAAPTTSAQSRPSSSSASCVYSLPTGVRRGPGMGLHVGWAIEGAIGSRHKIDATYLSPNVNMAARLAAATKQYAVGLLFSRSFYKLLPRILQDRCRHVDNVLLKGCAKPISIYTFDIWLPKSDDATSATTAVGGATTTGANQAMRAPVGATIATGTASAASHLAPPLPSTMSALASPSGLPVSSPTPLLPSSPSVLIDISGIEEATGSSRGNSNLIPHGAAGSSLAPTPADTPAAAAATASAKGSAVPPGFMSMALPASTSPAQGVSSPSSAQNSGNPTPASASASHTRNPSVHVTWNVALTDSSGQPLGLATTAAAATERKGAASVSASGSTTPALQQPPPLKRPHSLGLPSGISSGGSRAMTSSTSHHQLLTLPPLGGSAVPSRQPSASPQPLSASLSVSPSPRLSSVSLEQHVRQSLDADMQRLNATRRSSLTGAHSHPLSSRAGNGAAGGSGSGVGVGAAASEGGHHSRRRSVSALQASHALQQQQQAELAHALHQQQLYQQHLLQQHLLQIQQQQQFQLWQQQQALADFGDASGTTASVSGVGGVVGVGGTVAASSTAFLMSPSPPPPASIAELGAQPLAHSLLPTSHHAHHHLSSAPPSAGQTPLLPSSQQLQPPDLASSRSTSSAWPTALSLDALSSNPPPPPSMQPLQEVRINMPPFGPPPPQQSPPANVTTDPLLQKLLFVLMSLQNHTAHPLLVLTHNHASSCYAQGDWLSARLLYEQVLAWQPNDGPATVLLEFMERTNFRPPPDWEGYRKLEKK